MGQISSKLRQGQDSQGGPYLLTYWCQGCEEPHAITYAPGRWTWDGNLEAPTFSPSVLVTSGHFTPDWTPDKNCWCTFNADHPDEKDDRFECGRCHTFIKGGMVQFLDDCTHALKGQTLPLPDLPASMRDDR